MGNVHIKADDLKLARKFFDEMWSSISVNSDESIPYPDFFSVDDFLPLLTAVISTGNIISASEKIGIVRTSFLTQRHNPEKDFDRFIGDINAKVRDILKLPQQTFYLSSKISFLKSSVTKRISKTMDNSRVTICAELPKKLQTAAWDMSGFGRVIPSEPSNYASLFATTTARTASQAARSMLADVELLVACLNLTYSSGRIILRTGKNRPLSQIRLGKFQIIHDSSGTVDKDRIWYEGEYDVVDHPTSLSENLIEVRKFMNTFFAKLESSQLRSILEGGIRQYTAALNTREPQLCLIRLWSALEILMQSAAGGSKVTARRAAFFSGQYDYRLRKLHHIAEVRNGYIHSGSEITLVDELVGDLKIYLSTIIRLMVFSEIRNLTKNQLSLLLDMPADLVAIRERVLLTRLGLKMRK